MVAHIELGEIIVDVVLKDIKNIHLSVYPPTGRVRISAPRRMDLDTIRVFALSKLGWIKAQQNKYQAQERETPREYLDRESHYLWGKRYLLKIVEVEAAPSVELAHSQIVLFVRPYADEQKKQAILEDWYRQQLKDTVPELLEKWQRLMGIEVQRFYVQRMKTRWGSCNHHARRIRLNTDLAKKSPECLEYVLVHEMAHLVEPTHNARFVALMDHYLPAWKHLRDQLNQAPLGYATWEY